MTIFHSHSYTSLKDLDDFNLKFRHVKSLPNLQIKEHLSTLKNVQSLPNIKNASMSSPLLDKATKVYLDLISIQILKQKQSSLKKVSMSSKIWKTVKDFIFLPFKPCF